MREITIKKSEHYNNIKAQEIKQKNTPTKRTTHSLYISLSIIKGCCVQRDRGGLENSLEPY